MLDPHRLRIFRSVVAGGSVRAAAASLGYTPSAVSQHISALQRETRLTLFERAGRGLRPTEAGRTLAIQADAVLAQLGQPKPSSRIYAPGEQVHCPSPISPPSARHGCRALCAA